MEFSRQEYWSGLPLPSPEDLPDPGVEPGSPALQVDFLLSQPPGRPHARLDLYILNKFSISLLISAKKKKPIGILVVIALTLYINFGGSVQSLIRV